MKVLFAPDSFKGTMSSAHVIDLLRAITPKYFPDCEMLDLPIGDGGEGTAEALVKFLGGRYEYCTVADPFGRQIVASYGVLDSETAVLEVAQASGLPLLKREELNIMKASSYGSGLLLRHVIEKGFRKIYLLLGGSATNDGGLGLASALGIRFLDQNGDQISLDGAGLSQAVSIDTSELLHQARDIQISIMCDVSNPLLGPNGAAYVYGRQKGATESELEQLEAGMENYISLVEATCGHSFRDMPGCGAAGGMAVPLIAFMDTKLLPGIETVFSLVNFDQLLQGVDLVITGEGRLDSQSIKGKVLSGIGVHCKEKGIPVAAIVGCMGEGAELIYHYGVVAVTSCTWFASSFEEALQRPDDMFMKAAEQLFRILKLGSSLPR